MQHTAYTNIRIKISLTDTIYIINLYKYKFRHITVHNIIKSFLYLKIHHSG